MATLYTTSLKLALPTTGELAGTWGTVVNQSITSMVEQAITGVATINTWGVAPDPANTHTLTVVDGASSESRCAVLVIAGSPSGDVTVIAPSVPKTYIVNNTLSYDATIKTALGTGVRVPAGNILTVYGNGTNFYNTVTGLSPTVTIGGSLEGATTKRALQITTEVQNDVTTRATMFYSNPSTEADTWASPLANLEGFRAEQGTFGAGSSVTNQFGFIAASDLTGATFNYGFYSSLAAASASTITNINGNGTDVTVTTSAAHGLTNGDKVYISQVPMSLMTSGTYNGGPFTITYVDADTFTYTSTATSSAFLTSGSVVLANNYNFYTSTANSYFGGPVINRVSSVLPALSVRQTGTGNAFVVEDESPDATPFVINATGSVIIGSTEQISNVPLNIINVSGATVNMGRNDTSVASGDVIGRFVFYANDNTTKTWNDVAAIAAYAGGTHADNDYPTYLSFSTTQVAGTNPVERVRIAANGLTTVGYTATAAGTALSTSAPAILYAGAITYTDTQTAGAGTVTHGTFTAFATPTLDSTNVVTYTNASTVYIGGAPADGGAQITITNPYALYVNSGASYFGGNATITGTATINGVTTLNSSPIITTTNAGGATSLTIWNKGDSNASTTVELIAQQAISGSTPRNGGKIVFGRENASAWTTTTNADGFIAFQTVLNNTDGEKMRITSAGYVGINETQPDTYLHIKTALTTAPVLIESTEAGTAVGPFIDFYRNSASPVAGDDLGGFVFYGNDSGTAKQEYARIVAEITDPAATSEDGDLLFYTTNAGTSTLNMRLTSGGDLEIPNGVLGVGTAAPATLIDMAASNSGLTSTTANNTLRFTDTAATNTNQPLGKIEFYTSDTSTAARVVSYIMSKAQGTSGGGDLRFATSTNTGNATENMVLDKDGNLTVTGTVTANGTTLYPPTSGTVQTATGATVTFTGIPSWAKKVTVMFSGVSRNNDNQIMIQIGDSGGFENSGYTGGSQLAASPFDASGVSYQGYPIYFNANALFYSGALTLYNITGNVWVLSGVLSRSDGYTVTCAGTKGLSAVLTQVQITREPADTTGVFDGGQFNILYE